MPLRKTALTFSFSSKHQTHLALEEDSFDIDRIVFQHPIAVGDGQAILFQLQTAQSRVEEDSYQQLLLFLLFCFILEVVVLKDSCCLSTTNSVTFNFINQHITTNSVTLNVINPVSYTHLTLPTTAEV